METTQIIRNEAYFNNTLKLSSRRQLVFDVIKKNGMITAQEIRLKLRLGINQISGRLTELKDAGLIMPVGSKLNIYSNCHNTLFRVASKHENIKLTNRLFIKLRTRKDEIINEINTSLFMSETTKKNHLKELKTINKKIESL